jgi:hypothetical protein
LAWAGATGCAGGVDGNGTFGAPNRLDDGGEPTSTGTSGLTEPGKDDTPVEDGGDEGPGGMPGGDLLPDFGSCTEDADCFAPAVTCFSAQGSCDAGICVHQPSAPGVLCNDSDPCTEDDMCDGAGFCVGNDLECSFPNTSGGVCNAGMCSGMTCLSGFDDCNGNPGDGCETALNTAGNCGGCGTSCSAGAHATADCSSGSCQRACQAPWDNCDGNWGNGCEIPTGIPNQCDANGLNAGSGCWTAYCGASASGNATNFGTFYCMDCATCHQPGGGTCQWCNHTSGTWYPQDVCACGGYLDLTCG